MDDNRLAEIRERADKADGLVDVSGKLDAIRFARNAHKIVRELLAEVERLTAMTEMISEDMRHFAEVAEDRGVEIARLTDENARLARELGATKHDLKLKGSCENCAFLETVVNSHLVISVRIGRYGSGAASAPPTPRLRAGGRGEAGRMARLIDAEAFREKCLTWLHVDSTQADGQDDMAACMVMEIDAAPTVDAETVRRGEWIPNSPFTGNCRECRGDGNLKQRFCGGCGARMDGEGGGEE